MYIHNESFIRNGVCLVHSYNEYNGGNKFCLNQEFKSQHIFSRDWKMQSWKQKRRRKTGQQKANRKVK